MSRYATAIVVAIVVLLGVVGWLSSQGYSVQVALVTPSPESTPSPVPTKTPAPTVPPNSRVGWTTNPVTTTSTGARFFTALMTNNDPTWTLTNIVVELKLLDANGQLVQQYTATVPNLPPGSRGDYRIVVPSDVRYEVPDIHAAWNWVPPR